MKWKDRNCPCVTDNIASGLFKFSLPSCMWDNKDKTFYNG